MTCIFCAIVTGDAPSRTVYEDTHVIAFLDANPLARGHTLVIPKQHYDRLNEMPNDSAISLMRAIIRLLDPIETAVDAPATTIAFNNGSAAGQEIPHVHGHIIPRSPGDAGGPIHAVFRSRPSVTDEQMSQLRDQIVAHLTDNHH